MKNNKLNLKSDCSQPKQIGKTASVEGSKSPKVNADENIQRAIKIMSKKDYVLDYCPNEEALSGSPFINLSFLVTTKSFSRLPKGFRAIQYQSGLQLKFDMENVSKEIEQSEAFAKASINLLKWTKQLPKSVFVQIDIDIPQEIDPSRFVFEVGNKLQLYSYQIANHTKTNSYLIYGLSLEPQRVKLLIRELRAFAEASNTKIKFSQIMVFPN